ncbi:hypothetical protein AAC387_Pa12g1350 [Persea americana]
MLLYPKSASEEHCNNLKVNIDNTKPTKYYVCSWNCCAHGSHLISTVYDSKSASTMLKELGIYDVSVLEERNVNVGAAEVVRLLNCLILTKTPLTDVFLQNQDTIDRADLDSKLEEHVVSLAEEEAASLLIASLISKTVLTDVFCPKKPKHLRKKSYKRGSKLRKGLVEL